MVLQWDLGLLADGFCVEFLCARVQPSHLRLAHQAPFERAYLSCSSFFAILPDEVRGNSVRNSIRLGSL